MIITIIFVGITLLGIISNKLSKKFYNDFLEIFGGISTAIGSAGLIILIIAIIAVHATASKTVQENKINYEGLCMRAAIIKSDYEDVSKSDVMADVTAWNIEVYNTKYWASNPWTNWFNPKVVADNLNYISFE